MLSCYIFLSKTHQNAVTPHVSIHAMHIRIPSEQRLLYVNNPHRLTRFNKQSNFFFINSSSPLPVTNGTACGDIRHSMRGRMASVLVTNYFPLRNDLVSGNEQLRYC